MTNPREGRGKLVLVVEDDPEIAKLEESKLERYGYSVQICSRLSVATAKLHNQKFDAIVLDLKIEGGNGETVIDNIRSNKKNTNFKTPVILVSGNLDPQTLKRNLSRVYAAMVKPFSEEEFVDKVGKATGVRPNDKAS